MQITCCIAELILPKFLQQTYTLFLILRNPTVDDSWKASTSTEIDYLYIKTENDTMRRGLLSDRFNFWKNSLAHPINGPTFDDRKVISKIL